MLIFPLNDVADNFHVRAKSCTLYAQFFFPHATLMLFVMYAYVIELPILLSLFFNALPHIRTYALASIILYERRRFATMNFTKEQVNQQKKKKGTADVASTRQ